MILRIKILNTTSAILTPLNSVLRGGAVVPLPFLLKIYEEIRRYSADAQSQTERTEVELHNIKLKRKFLAMLKEINSLSSRDTEDVGAVVEALQKIKESIDTFHEEWTKDTTNVLKYFQSLMSIADKYRDELGSRDRDRLDLIQEKTKRSCK